MLIIVFILIISIFVELIGEKKIIIEDFEVALDLQNAGFTKKVVGNLLIDNINNIKVKSKDFSNKLDIKTLRDEDVLKIQIPTTGISVRQFISLIRNLIPFIERDYVYGEIFSLKDNIKLSISIDNSPRELFIVEKSTDLENDLKELLIKAAEKIYSQKQPETLLRYYYYEYHEQKNNRTIWNEKGKPILKDILKTGDNFKRLKVYLLSSIILANENNYKDAFKNLKEAEKINFKNPEIYDIQGRIHAKIYNEEKVQNINHYSYDNAIVSYQKAIKNSEFTGKCYPRAYKNLGNIIKDKTSEKSRKGYKQTGFKNKKEFEDHIYKNFEKAIEKYDWSINCDESYVPAYRERRC